jgi:hypothetical protein
MWIQISYNGKPFVTRWVSGMEFVQKVRWFSMEHGYDVVIQVPGE